MKSADVDLSRHISLQIKALKLFGIWFYIPYSKKTFRFWFGILSRLAFGILVFVVPTGGQFLYVVRLLMSGNAEVQEVAGIINLVLGEFLASIRLLDLCLRRDALSRLANELVSEQFQGRSKPHRIILERAVHISRWLFWGMLCSCILDISVHVIIAPAMNSFKTLPLKMDLIWFDVNEDAYFKFICIYQIIYKPMMLTTFVSLSTLPWAAMSFAISQLDVLIYNFENIKELVYATVIEKGCDANEAFKEVFKGCVLHHCSIIRFVNIIQAAFGGQLSSTLFLNACIICTTAVQIFSIESPWKNISEVVWILAYLVIILSSLFIDCYFGNTITAKGMHLSRVVFSCSWVTLPTESKKNLVLFIAKTQQPIVITAAKLVPVSFETFTKLLRKRSSSDCCYSAQPAVTTTQGHLMEVMNWTYKGFAVMNQMKK